MNKKLSVLGIILVFAIGITSCLTYGANEKVVLTYWNGFTGPDRPALEALVDKFNKTNSKIEIKMDIMPWDSLYQKLAPALATGQGPDIVAFATERIGTYAKPGAIVPLDDLYAGSDGLDAKVLPKALNDNMKYNGKYYGAPMNFATLLLYYNKDLFKQAGLNPEKPPKDWNELKDYAIKLTKESNGKVDQYGFGIASKETIPMWPILIWGNGGDFINYSTKTSMINNEKSVKAVQYFADLILKKHISPPVLTGAEVDKLFESQKAAMYMCGPWAVNGFKQAKINFGVAPIPAGPAKTVTLGTGVAMCLTKSSNHKKEVYEFFKYWNSKESQIYWALNTGFPPNRTDLVNDPALKVNPYVVAFSSVANQTQFYLQQLTNFGKIDTDVVTPAMENILLGKMTVKESLDKAAREMNKMLK
ncbi:MAG TPA: ABC transporter substrate-binding protein [Firmicutes bacterium]|jgi:multiple sugar transport system substrate-binding protein|nr:ABC transporter substrate-binding protein [Bacillota bacterium]